VPRADKTLKQCIVDFLETSQKDHPGEWWTTADMAKHIMRRKALLVHVPKRPLVDIHGVLSRLLTEERVERQRIKLPYRGLCVSWRLRPSGVGVQSPACENFASGTLFL